MFKIENYNINNEYAVGSIKIIDTQKDIYLDLILKISNKFQDTIETKNNEKCNKKQLFLNKKKSLKVEINNKAVYTVNNFKTEVCIKNLKLKGLKHNGTKVIAILIEGKKIYEYNEGRKEKGKFDYKKLEVENKNENNDNSRNNSLKIEDEYKVIFIDEDIKLRKEYEEEINKTMEKDLKKVIEYHNIDNIINDVRKQK